MADPTPFDTATRSANLKALLGPYAPKADKPDEISQLRALEGDPTRTSADTVRLGSMVKARTQPAPVGGPPDPYSVWKPGTWGWGWSSLKASIQQVTDVPARIGEHYLNNYWDTVTQFTASMAGGKSLLEAPGQSLKEVVEVPLRGLAQTAELTVGHAAHFVTRPLVGEARAHAIEEHIDQAIAPPNPQTELGREWGFMGVVFAPATAAGPLLTQTYHDYVAPKDRDPSVEDVLAAGNLAVQALLAGGLAKESAIGKEFAGMSRTARQARVLRAGEEEGEHAQASENRAPEGGEKSPIDRELDEDLARESVSRGTHDAQRLGLHAAATKVLGPQRMHSLQFLHDERGLPEKSRAGAHKIKRGNQLLGLATRDGQFYVFTGAAHTPELVAWTAVHEVGGHGGIGALIRSHPDVTIGGLPVEQAYRNIRATFLSNNFVRRLGEKIGKVRRPDNWDTYTADQREAFHLRMGEEAMAELQAAKRTGNWKRLGEQYGLEHTEAFRAAGTKLLGQYVQHVKAILNAIYAHISGKRGDSFTDADVHDMLDRMWDASQQAEGVDEGALASEVPHEPVPPKEAEDLQRGLDAAQRDHRLNAAMAGAASSAENDVAKGHAVRHAQDMETAARGGSPSTDAHAAGDLAPNFHPDLIAAKQTVDESLAAMDDFDKETSTGNIKVSGGLSTVRSLRGEPTRELSEAGKINLANYNEHVPLLQQMRDAYSKLRRTWSELFPNTMGEHTQKATTLILKRMFTSRWEQSLFNKVNKQLMPLFAQLNKDQLVAWWRNYQQGVALPEDFPYREDWASINEYYRNLAEKLEEREKNAGVSIFHRSGYIPQYLKPLTDVPLGARTPERMLEAFQHERNFNNMDEVFHAGRQPISLNPAVHWEYRMHAHVRAMNRTVLNDLLGEGLIRAVPYDYRPKPDELTFTAPDGVTHYAAPDSIVHTLRNSVLSEPLTNAGARWMAGLRLLSQAKMIATAPILAVSLFHPVHIEFFVRRIHPLAEATRLALDEPFTPGTVADMGKALGDFIIGRGDKPRVRGEAITARDISKLLTGKTGAAKVVGHRIVQPDHDVFDEVYKVLRGEADPDALHAPELEALRRLGVGGFNPRNHEWTNQALSRFKMALAEHTTSGVFRASGWAIPTLLRSTSWPIMDYYVPLMKLRAYISDTERWSKAHPGAAGSELEGTTFRRYARENDQRYGEMATGNLFWNKYLTAVMQGSMLSFGWNLGLISQFGGAGKDAAETALKMFTHGNASQARSRMLYASIYIGWQTGLGMLITKFAGGKDPTSLKDGIYPVLHVDPDGKEHRVSLPSLAKDFGGLYYHIRDKGVLSGMATEVMNKSAPLFSLMHMIATNHNYFDQEISDPYAPWLTRAGQKFRALSEAETPIAVQQIFARSLGEKESLLAIAGINPAPMYSENSKAVAMIYEASALLKGPEQYAASQRSAAERDAGLRELYHQGAITGNFNTFWTAFIPIGVKFHMTPKQIKGYLKALRLPPAALDIRGIPAEAQVQVWKAMSPTERNTYWQYFSGDGKAQILALYQAKQ